MTRLVVVEDGLHSDLGPSSADRWINCPGSVLLCKTLPERESRFAAEGTAAHTLSQWCREKNLPASRFKGIIIKTGGFEFPVDQAFADGVQEFVDYVNQYEGDAGYELRVTYEKWVKGGFGTLDDARLRDLFCALTDLKFGKGVQVFAKENAQLKLYGLGVYNDFKHLYDFDKFVLTVHQPRLDHVDEWETNIKDTLEWAEDVVRPAAVLAMKPGAPFKAGKWCMFCKAKLTCRTRAESIFTDVVGEFEDLDEAVDKAMVLGDKDARRGGLEFMENDELARVGTVVDIIAAWCKDIKAALMQKIQHGEEVGDWKLVEGRSRRKWNADDNTMAALLAMEGVDEDDIWKKKLITPPKAEQILGKKHEYFKEYVNKPQGKPVLVPGSDRRPPLAVDALKEFDNLDEELDDEEEEF